MSMHIPPHLVVSISGHGFGHVAQTAPILNALYMRLPQLRLTVRSTVPLAHLKTRIRAPFAYLKSEGDIGMVMSSALDVLVEDSQIAYRAFHVDWNERVAEEARLLRDLDAGMVLSNVGYLTLAGAQLAGIPNVALCSLNWADIYHHYCGEDAIAAQIRFCYANADAFFRATPGMAMCDLPNLVPVAPIATVGTNRRDELNRHLGLSRSEKLVLVSMGGIVSRLPIESWPRIVGVRWLVQGSWQVMHPDAIAIESLPMNFNDLLSSSDALICKPGYGSFVEAVCSGVPVLYVRRDDWPESSPLAEWLQLHGIGQEISRQSLEKGEVGEFLKILWSSNQTRPVILPAVDQITDWLEVELAQIVR